MKSCGKQHPRPVQQHTESAGGNARKEIISPEEAAEKCKKNITAEVICKVDTSAYEERVSRRKAAESIKSKMTQMVRTMDEKMKYEMYASKNAEFASMYAKYKELLK